MSFAKNNLIAGEIDRKKIETGPESPQYIQTHIGVGYRMLKVE